MAIDNARLDSLPGSSVSCRRILKLVGADGTRTRLYVHRDRDSNLTKLVYDILISLDEFSVIVRVTSFEFLLPDQHFFL